MTQQLNGRRGAVFSIRVTDDERGVLLDAQRRGGGPRHLGPWILWSALERARDVLAARAGMTPRARVVPRALAGEALPHAQRIILDLCSGTGSWSAPYAQRGYDVRRVTLPELDVRTFVPPPNVWGVLAAPPCDQFSMARNGHPELDRDYVRGMACVNACMRIVLQCRPRWWALENPVGKLSAFLGTPRDVFEPCDFGDPWTKRTALWGDFTIPLRGPFVEPLGGGPFCQVCDPARRRTTWCNDSDHRAITPPGFAEAFFSANP